ncbi:hypothetical protein T492DRAFT_1094775 [Pavlovales sp. CCMP2436]|nr:hypothetical protein T492DRAFT_1094775 [Pavlovales sp. CCMP2436]|mmetsp:Transcript_14388/g.34157  ORF Transcript_14388/g.34157 Transcript_14388/m.34157 type:complete len:166 (+) Transcript_14388:397-894(+)
MRVPPGARVTISRTGPEGVTRTTIYVGGKGVAPQESGRSDQADAYDHGRAAAREQSELQAALHASRLAQRAEEDDAIEMLEAAALAAAIEASEREASARAEEEIRHLALEEERQLSLALDASRMEEAMRHLALEEERQLSQALEASRMEAASVNRRGTAQAVHRM